MSYDEGEETKVGTERVRVFSGTGPPNPLPKASRRAGSKSAAATVMSVEATSSKTVNEEEEEEVSGDAA